MPTLLETVGIMDPKAKDYLERFLNFSNHQGEYYKANKELIDNKFNNAFKNFQARLPNAYVTTAVEDNRTKYLKDLCNLKDSILRYKYIERDYFILLNTLLKLMNTDIADLPKIEPIETINITAGTTIMESNYDNIDRDVGNY